MGIFEVNIFLDPTNAIQLSSNRGNVHQNKLLYKT